MIDFRDLELVEAILSHGNLARAARALGLGQPVLSRRLADFERRLGGELFQRHHGRAEPTDLCRALSANAAGILDRMRGLERSLAEARGRQMAELRIAAGGIAAETCVLAAAADMLHRLPHVRLNVASMNWLDVRHAVLEREAELGILDLTAVDDDRSEFVVEPLLRHPAFFVTRAGHPLAGCSSVTLADVLRYPFVFLGKVPTWLIALFAAARETAREHGPAHPAFPALVHEGPTASLQVVLASDAVGVATITVAKTTLETGALAILPLHEPWSRTNYGIITVRGRPISEGANIFMDVLRETDRRIFAEGEVLLDTLVHRRPELATLG